MEKRRKCHHLLTRKGVQDVIEVAVEEGVGRNRLPRTTTIIKVFFMRG
jgi:hypothetical protein